MSSTSKGELDYSTRTKIAIGAIGMICAGSVLPWKRYQMPSGSLPVAATDGAAGLISFGLGMAAAGLVLAGLKGGTEIWWRIIVWIGAAATAVSVVALAGLVWRMAEKPQSVEVIGIGLPLSILGGVVLVGAAYKPARQRSR